MTILKIITFIILFIVGVAFITLYRNDGHLFDDPGVGKRLAVYMTSNSAKTSDDHVFPELRTPIFNVDAEKLFQRVLYAAGELGWTVAAHDSDNLNANLVVRSPMFLFEDDVFVQVKFVDMNNASLYVTSHSRMGKADFGANNGNIQKLLKAMISN